MKIKDGRITILVGANETRIEIEDRDASIQFVEVKLTPEQLSLALSRMAYVECDIEVRGLEYVGKTMEHKRFEFEIPKDLKYKDRKEIVRKICLKVCPEGWEPDNSFNSQNSFFNKDEERWARTTIRRWV